MQQTTNIRVSEYKAAAGGTTVNSIRQPALLLCKRTAKCKAPNAKHRETHNISEAQLTTLYLWKPKTTAAALCSMRNSSTQIASTTTSHTCVRLVALP